MLSWHNGHRFRTQRLVLLARMANMTDHNAENSPRVLKKRSDV